MKANYTETWGLRLILGLVITFILMYSQKFNLLLFNMDVLKREFKLIAWYYRLFVLHVGFFLHLRIKNPIISTFHVTRKRQIPKLVTYKRIVSNLLRKLAKV